MSSPIGGPAAGDAGGSIGVAQAIAYTMGDARRVPAADGRDGMKRDVAKYFELDAESPYMLVVAPVREEHHRQLSAEEKSLEGLDTLRAVRSSVPAITHVDYVVRSRIRDARKADIWIQDQYYNPDETWHSIGEVLRWFEENDVEFLNCSPAVLGTDGEDAPDLFAKTDPGTRYRRVVTQLGWIGTIAREGSLFDMIGRKRG